MQMKYRIVALFIVVLLSGCGGGGPGSEITLPPPPEPTAVVFISAPPVSLAVDARASVSAVAIFPSGTTGGNAAVTWTVTCGSPGSCGGFSANDDAAAVTFTAPPQIPSGETVMLKATSLANPSVSASSAVMIVPPIPISVSFSAGQPASIQVGAAINLGATVLNDVSANPEVAWTVACGSAACGSLQPATTSSGSPTTYTAPAAIPSGATVTVTATSVTDGSKSASLQIVVTAAAPTLANGTYVFQIAGSPGSAANFVTGVLVATNGQITGGEQDSISYATDVNGNPYGNPLFQTITGGSYATTADGNLQISIALGPDEVETLYGTLGGGTQGFVANLNGVSASASLDLQSGTTAPSGGYAISLFGGDGTQEPTWLGGVVNIDGPGSISGAGSILDVVDGGGQQGGTYSLGIGSVSAADAQGRVLIQLQTNSSALPPIGLVGYIVDATHIRLIGSGDPGSAANYQGVLGGLALGQGTGTGQFSTAAVSGSSYVFGAQGSDQQGPLQIAGVLTLGANGSATGVLNWNDLSGKAAQAPLSFTGTYALDPTGRVTLTQLTDASSFSYSMHLYLAGENALLISNDANDSFDGQGLAQRTGAFSPASLSGLYGLNLTQFTPNIGASGLQESPVIGTLSTIAGSGGDSASGFADAGGGGADFAINGDLIAQQNGIFPTTMTGLDPGSRAATGSFTLYVVNGTQALLIETDANALTLGTLQNP